MQLETAKQISHLVTELVHMCSDYMAKNDKHHRPPTIDSSPDAWKHYLSIVEKQKEIIRLMDSEAVVLGDELTTQGVRPFMPCVFTKELTTTSNYLVAFCQNVESGKPQPDPKRDIKLQREILMRFSHLAIVDFLNL